MAGWKMGSLILAIAASVGLLSRPGPLHAQATGSTQPSGTVLASDKLTSDSGILPKSSSIPDVWTIGYTGSDYQITSTKPVTTGETVGIAGTYSDATVAVDVHLAQDSDNDTLVGLGCRTHQTADGTTGYRFIYFPTTNQYHLERFDGRSVFDFSGAAQFISGPPMITGTHHLQITCSGSAISASVDGQQAGSAQDGTYPDGRAVLLAAIGSVSISGGNQAGPISGSIAGTVDVRFTNLLVSQP